MSDTITPAQLNLVEKLVTERATIYRQLGEATSADMILTYIPTHNVAALTKFDASTAIDKMIATNKELRAKANAAHVAIAAAPKDATDDVLAGHYAIDWDGDISFWVVDRPTEGRWAGYTFTKRLVGPDEVRVSRSIAATALELIAKDPKAAAVRYGIEIGRCGICHRRLTVKASREAGIGPICASRF